MVTFAFALETGGFVEVRLFLLSRRVCVKCLLSADALRMFSGRAASVGRTVKMDRCHCPRCHVKSDHVS